MRVTKNLNQFNNTSKWKTSLNHYACAIRPVAAIMVTKISHFQALAETDQVASKLLLTQSYKLQEYYCHHYGCTRLVKMGEMVLVGFDSVEQATECALKLERSARNMFNHKLSIGIHLGEVRYVEGDLFGGPINVAHDVLNLAKPGEILLSESALRNINKLDYQVEAYFANDTLAVQTFKLEPKTETAEHPLWYHQTGGAARSEITEDFRNAM